MQITKGATSQFRSLFISDNSVATGAGLSGLVFNSAGLTCSYKRQTAGASVAVTLATAILGAWTSGGFKEIDATSMPGWYEFGFPNAALIAGADEVVFHLQGAANMVPVALRVELILPDLQTAIGLKRNTAFTALPFVMLDSTNHLPVAGKTVTVSRKIDAGAFGAGGLSAVTDAGSGLYTVNGVAGDLNGTFVTLKATATGCDDTLLTIVTIP
jgi:hypothetical protein